MTTSDEVSYLSASEQLRRFRRGELSPVDVLEAQLSRIERYNGKVNAITFEHFDEAREAAEESRRRYEQGRARPLEGITVAVKDEHYRAGWIVTEGSAVYQSREADLTDPVAQRLLEAGAILHIQTTAPEFYIHFCTWSKLWGVTRNPWNLSCTPGGSSGGSGAALAAGFCTIATGSDMGGSIRLPCGWNGLYGFKPPFGRVPSLWPLVPYSGSGPMARSFEDMVRMHNVIAQPHPDSPTTLPHEELPLDYPSIEGMKIAYSPDQGWAEIEPEVAKACADAVEVLRGVGAEVHEIDLAHDISDEAIDEWFLQMALAGPLGAILADYADRTEQLTSYGAMFAKKAASAGAGAPEALAAQNRALEEHALHTERVWSKGYDALLMPTAATPHVPADYDYTTDKPLINGKPVHPFTGLVLTPLYNVLNWYPVVAVPVGLSSRNVPIGLQVVANSYQDATAMRVAYGYASAAAPMFQGDALPDFRSK